MAGPLRQCGESCDQRAICVDNTAPGKPAGLFVTSSNPQRYLDRFSLSPNNGSPIAKVHYSVPNSAGDVVMPEKVVSGSDPTELQGIEGPPRRTPTS